MKTFKNYIISSAFALGLGISPALAGDGGGHNGPDLAGEAIPVTTDRSYSVADIEHVLKTCSLQMMTSLIQQILKGEDITVQHFYIETNSSVTSPIYEGKEEIEKVEPMIFGRELSLQLKYSIGQGHPDSQDNVWVDSFNTSYRNKYQPSFTTVERYISYRHNVTGQKPDDLKTKPYKFLQMFISNEELKRKNNEPSPVLAYFSADTTYSEGWVTYDELGVATVDRSRVVAENLKLIRPLSQENMYFSNAITKRQTALTFNVQQWEDCLMTEIQK